MTAMIRVMAVVITLSLCAGIWWQFRQDQARREKLQNQHLRVLMPSTLYREDWIQAWSQRTLTTLHISTFASEGEMVQKLSQAAIDLVIVSTGDLEQARALRPFVELPAPPSEISADFREFLPAPQQHAFWPVGWWVYGVISENTDTAHRWETLLTEETGRLRLPLDSCLLLYALKARGFEPGVLESSEERAGFLNQLGQLMARFSLDESLAAPPLGTRAILPHSRSMVEKALSGQFRLPEDQTLLSVFYGGVIRDSKETELGVRALKGLIEDSAIHTAIQQAGVFASIRKSGSGSALDASYLRRLNLASVHLLTCAQNEILTLETALAELGIKLNGHSPEN